MKMLREQFGVTAEQVFGTLYSAAFMLLWLFYWPLYRLSRRG